jgi:hypothetical protein
MVGNLEKAFASERSWDLLIVGILMLIPLYFATLFFDLSFLYFADIRYYMFGYYDVHGFHSFFDPISYYSILAILLWAISMGNGIMVILFFAKNQNKLRMKKQLKYAVLILFAVLIQFIMIWAFSTSEDIAFGPGFWLFLGIAIYLVFRLKYLRKNES